MKCLFRQNYLPFLMGAFLVLTACQPDKAEKDLTDPAPEQEAVKGPCKLKKEIIYEWNSNKVSSYSEYLYNPNDLINRINTFDVIYRNNPLQGDSMLAYFLTYTYNDRGKVVEEVCNWGDGSIFWKAFYTYNAANLLQKVDFQGDVSYRYDSGPSRIFIHYNNLGQRIRADFYSGTQPNQLERYYEYTYSPGVIHAKEFKATTNPATFFQNIEFTYDNKISRYHALGYLDAYTPDHEKHNLTLDKKWLPGYIKYSALDLEYDGLGYPIKGHPYQSDGFWETPTIEYQYDCN